MRIGSGKCVKASKAGKDKKAQKKYSFIHNVGATYCVYTQYFWEYALFQKAIGHIH